MQLDKEFYLIVNWFWPSTRNQLVIPLDTYIRVSTCVADHESLLKIIRLMRDGKNNALHEFIIFVGSSPSQGDIFFLKSDIKWAFFSYTPIH